MPLEVFRRPLPPSRVCGSATHAFFGLTGSLSGKSANPHASPGRHALRRIRRDKRQRPSENPKTGFQTAFAVRQKLISPIRHAVFW
ncbi:hypothetical protein [Kingella potus]|uniref:hypothetical protein n=1 Tax=Kingella potus TaxID=265175 RepID=UPI001FD0B708|nr:hypothetical protein [Kingella potus]UOP00791.1 hypothetical protein LVJ84_13735 [Kingella potus]